MRVRSASDSGRVAYALRLTVGLEVEPASVLGFGWDVWALAQPISARVLTY